MNYRNLLPFLLLNSGFAMAGNPEVVLDCKAVQIVKNPWHATDFNLTNRARVQLVVDDYRVALKIGDVTYEQGPQGEDEIVSLGDGSVRGAFAYEARPYWGRIIRVEGIRGGKATLVGLAGASEEPVLIANLLCRP